MFGSIWKRSSKNYKIPKKKETNVGIWFNKKKKANFQGFQVFDFAVYPKPKTRKSRKVLF